MEELYLQCCREGEMMDDPASLHRCSIRLAGYEYRQAGAYFATVTCHQREHLFGEIQGEQVLVSPVGKIVEETWNLLPDRFPHIMLDEYVIMPNHFHAILFITDAAYRSENSQRAGRSPAPTRDEDDRVGATLVVAPDGGVGPKIAGNSERSSAADRAGTRPAPTAATLGDIIGAFKSISTNEIIKAFDAVRFLHSMEKFGSRIITNTTSALKMNSSKPGDIFRTTHSTLPTDRETIGN